MNSEVCENIFMQIVHESLNSWTGYMKLTRFDNPSDHGHENTEGTLSYFLVILKKPWLGGKHPDYHWLLAAFMQVLDSLLLDAWRLECGSASLAAFAVRKPTYEQVLVIADRILYIWG
jgi:hypothetical protein